MGMASVFESLVMGYLISIGIVDSDDSSLLWHLLTPKFIDVLFRAAFTWIAVILFFFDGHKLDRYSKPSRCFLCLSVKHSESASTLIIFVYCIFLLLLVSSTVHAL